MKIVIDARFYGHEHTGLGRYTINFLQALTRLSLPSNYHFYLLVRRRYLQLKFPSQFSLVEAEITHYSLKEQLFLSHLIKSLQPDLFHALHFNVPYFYSRPFIVTVHDLIKSHFSSKETTTRSSLVFHLKRWGYHQVIDHALHQALNIVVPSQSIKQDILKFYPQLQSHRIIPIYEAPDPIFTQSNLKSTYKPPVNNYLLYVGNAYPHKNLKLLLQAFQNLNRKDLNLVIVSKKSSFLDKTLAQFSQLQSRIYVLQHLNDADLAVLYRQALLTVIPSLMEGFSLTGLESLALKTPVVASDIPVHHEIYGQAVRYANPYSYQDFTKAILQSLDDSYLGPLPRSYSWTKLAQSILNLYENYEKHSFSLRSTQ